MSKSSNALVAAGPAAQSGVGLIEVLVALVVISVGVLAIIGMQITGKQANYDAVQRTAASHLAADLIERMRANPTALSGYITGAVIGGATLAAPGPSCDAAASSCTASEMAAADLYSWERSMDGQAETRVIGGATVQTGGLVNPRACLSAPPGGGGTGTYVLTIVWRGTGELTPTAQGVCGNGLDGTALYGSDAAPANDNYRRVTSFTFFITT